MNQLTVTILADGTVKTDATQMSGSEAEILKELSDLARTLGANLEVERHVHKHGQGHSHSHKVKA